MRITILASGLSYHAARWANALARRGLDIAYVTHHREVTRPLDPGIEVRCVGRGSKLDYVSRGHAVRTFAERWGADLMHSHYATGYGFLGQRSGFRPRIVSVYGADIYDFPRKSLLHKRLLAAVLRGADQVLSTSETMADRTVAEYPKLPRPLVTPFGVDVDRFKPDPAVPRTGDGVLRVGIVKRLEVKYGVDVLLRACARLERPFELHIAGGGSQADALAALARTLGVAERTHFHGPIENDRVPEFINTLDLFAVPSRHDSESFGVAAVEAQSCGVPVIATDVGGLPEVVAAGETGLIVPREDAVALAEAISELADDVELRARMGSAARARVLELYDWEDSLDCMIGVYEEVVRRWSA